MCLIWDTSLVSSLLPSFFPLQQKIFLFFIQSRAGGDDAQYY